MAERSPKQWTFGHRQAAERARAGDSVVVLGLGRFGGAVGAELARLGYDVLGVDQSKGAVEYYTHRVSHVVQADITSTQVLRQLGVDDMTHAIVAVGSNLEASILATSAVDDLGIPNIWAKAVSREHGRILERVGAHHVVYPEHDMGHQVAHMIGGRILDWFQLDEQFALVETTVPSQLVGRTLAQSGIREKYNVTVVCVKPAGGKFTYATVDTKLAAGDQLVVAGETVAAEAFARLG